MKQSNELVTSTSEVSKVPANIPQGLEAQMELADLLVKSGLTPQKTKEDAMVCMMYGRELGFSPMVALQNIHSINGKAGIGIHLMTAQLIKHGIVYEIVEDYVNVDTPDPNNPKAAINKRTTVEITREHKLPSGAYRNVVTRISYTLKEASIAGLLEKDNWLRMPKIMLRTRAITIAARLAAPDILLGLLEYNELIEIESVRGNSPQNRTVTHESAVVESEVTVLKTEENTTTEQNNK